MIQSRVLPLSLPLLVMGFEGLCAKQDGNSSGGKDASELGDTPTSIYASIFLTVNMSTSLDLLKAIFQ